MTGTWLDVDAPNTNWRAGSEDPIPVLLGRWPLVGGIFRFVACRPLDGHARTDATFLHAGTQSFTKSGHTGAWNYWPGWKRGLLLTRVPPMLGLWAGAGYAEGALNLPTVLHYESPAWMSWEMPAGLYLPLAGWGLYRGVRMVQNRQHEKHYLRPIRQAAWAVLRTRDGVHVDIPRGLVHGRDLTATGRIGLPTQHAMAEGDRERLLDAVRERLGHEALDARWNMEGAHPWMELWTPPQPPPLVSWDRMLGHADTESPYLGHSAHGPVNWDMSEDSPHLGIGGGSGSGKSELMAWVVAQFMRGGCGTVVLDPKWTSHMWMSRVPEVLYCRAPQMLQDTILWLASELDRRGYAAVNGEPESPRIVVVLEERNSLQTILREQWIATRPKGAPMRSPALAALDKLASMGRSFNIHVVLAAQEVTKADIGSRNNFGAFALAGRLPVGAWRLVNGPGSKKPPITSKPGRFGYCVAGETTVFQAAYPNLRDEAERLIAFATSGNELLDVRVMMQQHEGVPFPRWEPAASPDDDTEEYVTLSQFADSEDCPYTLAAIRLHSQRDGRRFPDSQGTGEHNAKLYRLTDLHEWVAMKQEENGDA